MRRYILNGLCALCAGLMASEGFAQEVVRRRTGFAFLSLPTNARTEALGEVGVGLIGSGSAILYNPAGLAFMEGREAYFTYVDWIAGLSNYVTGVAANLSGKGTVGLSVVNFDYPPGNDISEYAISVAYGFNVTDRFAAGTTLKLVHQDYSELGWRKDDVFAFDLGAYFVTGFRNTVMAMSVQNLSARALGEPEQFGLPKRIRAGLLIDLISMLDLVPLPHYLDLVADVSRPIYSDGRTERNLGVEYTYLYKAAGYSLGVSLRGGHKFARRGSLERPETWGGGLQFKTEGGRGIEVDYASRSFDDFLSDDDVRILGIALNF